jgi:stress response protein SCP2
MKGGRVDTRIIVTLRMSVPPERRGDFLETLRGMLEPARVERGCVSYRLYEDVEDRNTFILLEDLLSRQPEWRFNTVSQTAGMDLIENVLKADIPE